MLFIIAGCTAQPTKVANVEQDRQCHSEETTGSMIPKSTCTTAIQRAAQQEGLDDVKRQVQSEAGTPYRPANPTAQ
jgi:hypothetical protein